MIEQAAEIDRVCDRACWSGHTRYAVADNLDKNWLAKSSNVIKTLTRWLASTSD